MALGYQWGRLVEEIRGVAGFSDFLSPLSYSDLLPAASGGPVIVLNLSQWRCDALVIETSGVQVVPLPALTLDDATERTGRLLEALRAFDDAEVRLRSAQVAAFGNGLAERQAVVYRDKCRLHALADANINLTEIMGWLWNVIVEPILTHHPLTSTSTGLPRIWWCPTGPLTMLPIHAAASPGGTSLLEIAVSSYTPSLHALVHARRQSGSVAAASRSALIVSTMPGTGLHSVSNFAHLGDTRVLVGEAATVASVKRALLDHPQIVHFNTHGDQDLNDPSRGALALQDGVLSVSDIANLALNGDFAGLGACKTALGGIDLPDESITLTSAMHYAGFRHVVGTLWSIAQGTSNDVFKQVYSSLVEGDLFEPRNAAKALSDAVRQLSREHPYEPHGWASLVHVGP